MSSICTFDFHVTGVYKRCLNLSAWILRTFSTKETRTMVTLFKSLVLSRLDYASQLWSPHLLKYVLPTREGPTFIYKTLRRDAYDVL